MINPFSMKKRVLSRLEKYVFDRVWNEPYNEYRTNTRPRILNGTSEASLGVDEEGQEIKGTVYQPMAGVLSGNFEQIDLPSSRPFYVYSIELEQFRPVKALALKWIALSDYCNLNHVDLRVYSDTGVFLWRGGIYIKQDPTATMILVAVDAEMLHRCLDVYTVTETGAKKLVKLADPTEIYFTKYVDTDTIEENGVKRLAPADNKISCLQLSSDDITRIKQQGVDPVTPGYTVAFYNGHVISGNHAQHFLKGGYVESVFDGDAILHETVIDRVGANAPLYKSDGTLDEPDRVLIHLPRSKNIANYLISYNTCDFYLIPQALTEDQTKAGYDVTNAGVIFHMCDRADAFHQLTHNDFSIDLNVLDQVARDNGFAEDALGRPMYYLHFVIRTMKKKSGFVRDSNYCDLLYTQSHTDEDIVRFLTSQESDVAHELKFWTGEYLEKHTAFTDAMLRRVAPSIDPEHAEGYFRPTIDRYFKAGKHYYTISVTGEFEPVVPIPGSPIPEGVVEYRMTKFETAEVPGTPGGKVKTREDELNVDIQDEVKHTGVVITKENQCTYCTLRDVCPKCHGSTTVTDHVCPDFQYRTIQDFINIFGYYNTLSLICKRVTTYRVADSKRQTLQTLECTGKKVTEKVIDEQGVERSWNVPFPWMWSKMIRETPTGLFHKNTLTDEDRLLNESVPVYADESQTIPVHIPLALFDLDYSEWYPMVYVNGDKVDDEFVFIDGFVEKDPVGLEEIHWTYTPSFDEDLLWETERKFLNVTLKEGSPLLKQGDYVTVELIPNPHDYVLTEDENYQEGKEYYKYNADRMKYVLLIVGMDYMVGEGIIGSIYEKVQKSSVVETVTETFDLDELEDKTQDGKLLKAFEPLGQKLHPEGGESVVRKGTELVYLNGKQLVTGIDYMDFQVYPEGPFEPTIQNIGYLKEEDNLLEAILTTDRRIGTAKGFVLGNKIAWDGVSPFWFDNLSILSVNGKVVSDFMFDYSGLYLSDAYDNGALFLVRTNVPSSVLDLIEFPEALSDDDAKLKVIRAYFDTLAMSRPYRALIPNEHKIYSTYLLKILKDYFDGEVDFTIYDESGRLLTPDEFKSVNMEMLAQYEDIKEYDVVFTTEHEGITTDNLRFVDIYPIYHNLHVRSNLMKRKVAYLMEALLPADYIRHREHVNGK